MFTQLSAASTTEAWGVQAGSQIMAPSAPAQSAPTPNAAPQAARGADVSVGGSTSAEQAVQFVRLADRREDAELEQAALKQRQKLPTTVEGFRKHPLYVLKRAIGKYQGLKPGTAPLGLHRGEPYFDRSALSELHSAEKWKRDGREVLPGELGQPCKLIQCGKKSKVASSGKPGTSQAAAAAEGTGEDSPAEVKLFQCFAHTVSALNVCLSRYRRSHREWQRCFRGSVAVLAVARGCR